MNINANVAGKEIAQPVVPTVETVDKNRPQVAPVEKSNDSAQTTLDEKALQQKAKDQQLSNEELSEAVENIQSRLDVMGTRLGFVINQETEDIIIVMPGTDSESGRLPAHCGDDRCDKRHPNKRCIFILQFKAY